MDPDPYTYRTSAGVNRDGTARWWKVPAAGWGQSDPFELPPREMSTWLEATQDAAGVAAGGGVLPGNWRAGLSTQ